MFYRFRYSFITYDGIDNYVNQFYGSHLDNSFFEKDSFTLGNVKNNGIELEFSKGNYTIQNTYYTRPYPQAGFYNTAGSVDFQYRLTYKFSPYNYFNNGFVLSDINSSINSNDDFTYMGHGAYVNGQVPYLANAFRIELDNNMDITSNDFYISTTAGSYNLDPNVVDGESPYLSVNLDISNYNLGTTPFALGSVFSSIYANENLIPNKFDEVINFNLDNSYSNPFSTYFRDFNNSSVSFSVGMENSLLKLNGDNYNFINPNEVILPTTSNFFGSPKNFGFMYTNDMNYYEFSNSLIMPESYYFNIDSYIYPSSVNELRDYNFSFFDTFQYYFESGVYGIDHFDKELSVFSLTHIGDTSNYIYHGNVKTDYMFDYDDITYALDPYFSNTLYFNNLESINLYIDGIALGLPSTHNDYSLPSMFNSAMNIGIGTYTIGGIITAVFLFRMLFAMLRSNK